MCFLYKNTLYQISAHKSEYLSYKKYLNMKSSLNKFKQSQEREIRCGVKAYDRVGLCHTM